MFDYFKKSGGRVSHTINRNTDVKRVPSNSNGTRPSANKPQDLRRKHKCASCAGGWGRK